MGNRGGRGRRLKASWERVFGCGIVASIPRKIRANWDSNQPPKRPRFPPQSRRDRALIGRRSWCQGIVDHLLIDGRQIRARISSIAARSRRDRGVLPRSSTAVRSCSNWMDDRDCADPVRRDCEANLLLAVRWRSSGLKASSHLL